MELKIENLALLEELYARYLTDPLTVEPSWRYFFEGVEFAGLLDQRKGISSDQLPSLRIFNLILAYRRYGHLLVPINPIASEPRLAPELELSKLEFSQEEMETPFPTLGFCPSQTAPLKEILAAIQAVYCSRIGFEFMDLGNTPLEDWIQKTIEPRLEIELSLEEKKEILESLIQSEAFESFLHTKYPGQKRFSLEGLETLIPVLVEMLEEGAKLGVEEFFLGMSHRGRLNVLANLLNKPYAEIFSEFEDQENFEQGGGDVKYHKGFSSQIFSREKKAFSLHLTPNPSHLEAVDPVVLGQTRACQRTKKTSAILIHGDAAITGQGVVYECLQLANLAGYSVGGTLHVIANNQIGFTTPPEEDRSTRYCTDIAKTFGAPVFHVNAEDPESCIYAAKLAMRIRDTFQCDVFLDLNGYRKYGHNEGDEPIFSQPLQYQMIRKKRSILDLYRDKLLQEGHIEQTMVEEIQAKFKATLTEAHGKTKEQVFVKKLKEEIRPVETYVDEQTLRFVMERATSVPADFRLHPKLIKWNEERLKMLTKNTIDWGAAECLALGTLLLEKTPIRLSGQDSRRGTFSHRHMMWVDQETSVKYFPLQNLKSDQGKFEILNSPLSEYAAMGFEVGYSWQDPTTFVIWEAQFGDFANGAQIVIDQYIASSEEKWNKSCSLTLLLPHSMEGQGPEHSSGRLERFLQLAANDSMRIANVSTPAQFFHLLRRQAKNPIQKPLVVFTPKSLLRGPACVSSLKDFTQGKFEEVLEDKTKAKRLLLCSGHVYYDLLEENAKQKKCAITRIEQLYPISPDQLKRITSNYSDVCWVQEETENMGAWEFLRPLLGPNVRYIGRKRSSSPATGSHKRHDEEKKAIIQEAFE